MKRPFAIAVILVAAISLLAASCARQPDTKRSAALIQKHFKKYGKKYPGTIFGKSKVKQVEITSQQEIHKHLVGVEAFLTLSDGTVERVDVTIEKAPLGWRFVSWENATN